MRFAVALPSGWLSSAGLAVSRSRPSLSRRPVNSLPVVEKEQDIVCRCYFERRQHADGADRTQWRKVVVVEAVQQTIGNTVVTIAEAPEAQDAFHVAMETDFLKARGRVRMQDGPGEAGDPYLVLAFDKKAVTVGPDNLCSSGCITKKRLAFDSQVNPRRRQAVYDLDHPRGIAPLVSLSHLPLFWPASATALPARQIWRRRSVPGRFLRQPVTTERDVIAACHPTPARLHQPDALRAVFATVLPQATVEMIPKAGHLSPIEAPGPIASACRDIGLVLQTRRPAGTARRSSRTAWPGVGTLPAVRHGVVVSTIIVQGLAIGRMARQHQPTSR